MNFSKRNKKNWQRRLRSKVKAFGFMLLVVITISWTVYVAETLAVEVLKAFRQPCVSDWLGGWRWPQAWPEAGWALGRLLAATAMLLALTVVGLKWSGRILQLHVRSKRRRPEDGEQEEGARGLVVFLSPPPPGQMKEHGNCLQGIQEDKLTLQDIAAGRKIPGNWNWQPLFTSMLLCRDAREPLHLVVLTSQGERGSDLHYSDLEKAVHKLAPEVRMHKVIVTDAWSPQEIVSALEDALEYLESRQCRLQDKQVLIDITGGTAAMSAIGAIFALQEGRRIIYGGKQQDGIIIPIVFRPSVSFFSDFKME